MYIVTCEIPALQAWQLNCVGTCDVNSNCVEEQKQGNVRNHCSQIEGNNNMLDENLELLKPEASNNVVSSSAAMCFIIISCVIMVFIYLFVHKLINNF